jgi:hypothetical protein
MRRTILILSCAILSQLLFVSGATAFPGERMPYRVAHFFHRAAYNVNYHVVHPVVHGVARRLP